MARRPVAGASVELTGSRTTVKRKTVTDDKWHFGVGVAHGAFAGTFTLTVSKRGYVTEQKTLRSKKWNDDLEIILRAE